MLTRRDLLGTSLIASLAAGQSPQRPDDWGFGHARAYGCKWIRTPNFDRVAREGMLFHSQHANL